MGGTPAHMMNYKILIPARGGSKRIVNKNIVDLNGKPLISYVIQECLSITDEVYVSTDSNSIKNISSQHGAKVLNRPDELSGDFSKSEDAVRHFLNIVNCDVFVLVQATSPLMRISSIMRGLELMNTGDYDSIMSVVKDVGFYWSSDGCPVNFALGDRERSQDKDIRYKETGSFYITKSNNFLDNTILQNGRVGFVATSILEAIDIDDHKDLFLVNGILNGSFKDIS